MFHLCALPGIETKPHAATRPKKRRPDQLEEPKRRANGQSHPSAHFTTDASGSDDELCVWHHIQARLQPPVHPAFCEFFRFNKEFIAGRTFLLIVLSLGG